MSAARLELDRKAGQGLDRIANLLLQLVIIIDHFVGTSKQTLPEAQRTQGIESITQIITHGKNYFTGEMKYMSHYKNQAWSLKLEKSMSEL